MEHTPCDVAGAPVMTLPQSLSYQGERGGVMLPTVPQGLYNVCEVVLLHFRKNGIFRLLIRPTLGDSSPQARVHPGKQAKVRSSE